MASVYSLMSWTLVNWIQILKRERERELKIKFNKPKVISFKGEGQNIEASMNPDLGKVIFAKGGTKVDFIRSITIDYCFG